MQFIRMLQVKAKDRVVALGIAVGSGYLFETDFQKRSFLRPYRRKRNVDGSYPRDFAAQYEVLRANGHSPSEAFNETVEELTSL